MQEVNGMLPYNASSERRIKELTTFGESDEANSIVGKLIEAREILERDFRKYYFPNMGDEFSPYNTELEKDRINAKIRMYKRIVQAYEKLGDSKLDHKELKKRKRGLKDLEIT